MRSLLDPVVRAARFVRRAVPPATRLAAGIIAVSRLVSGVRAAAPLSDASPMERSNDGDAVTVDVVIPARDEEARILPALEAVRAAPGVRRVIVVDDQSSDDTAAVAAAAGATVVSGAPLPSGWAGKAWAIQQGVDESDAEWIVTLDADTRPDPRLPAALVSRAASDGYDFVTVGGRFDCPTRPTRWLHASMLTTLVYRFGPPGIAVPPHRQMANGQCMVFRRGPFRGQGGMSGVKDHVVEDIALARRLAGRGWTVGFLDASDLLRVRMFESFRDAWTGWGRSLVLPGVEPEHRQMLDLAVVTLAQAVPLLRLLLGRADLLDIGLLAIRLGTLVGTRSAYDRVDLAYWTSPFADLLSVVALATGISRGDAQEWRGRTYG